MDVGCHDVIANHSTDSNRRVGGGVLAIGGWKSFRHLSEEERSLTVGLARIVLNVAGIEPIVALSPAPSRREHA
jgi:hypothetical protein